MGKTSVRMFATALLGLGGGCASSTNPAGTSNGSVTTSAGSPTGTAATTGAGAPTGSGATTGVGATTGATTGTSATSGSAAGGNGGRFPATAIFYQDISAAALDPSSATFIGSLADAGGWGTPFSHAFQVDFSLTLLEAGEAVQPRAFAPTADYYRPDCDLTAVPVPPGGNSEGAGDYACDPSMNDCHLLIHQGTRLYELFHATIAGGAFDGNPFTSQCEVAWDLTRDYWQAGATYGRGDQCSSADAAGMPIAPLLVTGAELQSGVVSHALRLILPNPEIQAGIYVHPATHAGTPTGSGALPPYGARFRLRADFDLTALPSAAARIVARALQLYGMFLDDGGNIPLTLDQSAAPLLGSHDLALLEVSDFEVVASPDAPVALGASCDRTPLTH